MEFDKKKDGIINRNKIILVGGGGHCKSCIDVIEDENEYEIEGIIDFPNELGKKVLGYPVIGSDDDLPALAKLGYNFIVTLGHMGNNNRRKELADIIFSNGGQLPTIISRKAYISKYSQIGLGTIIMHNALINADVKIGTNCIINSKVLIEHDVVIGDNCHVSPNASINGNCRIFDNCFIGGGSIIKNGLCLESGTIIGLGSVVIKDIIEKGIYFGNPARKTL